jgi:hypothetical protein
MHTAATAASLLVAEGTCRLGATKSIPYSYSYSNSRKAADIQAAKDAAALLMETYLAHADAHADVDAHAHARADADADADAAGVQAAQDESIYIASSSGNRSGNENENGNGNENSSQIFYESKSGSATAAAAATSTSTSTATASVRLKTKRADPKTRAKKATVANSLYVDQISSAMSSNSERREVRGWDEKAAVMKMNIDELEAEVNWLKGQLRNGR